MIVILGYIFAAILTLILLYAVYIVLFVAVVAADEMRFICQGEKWSTITSMPNWRRELVRVYVSCVADQFSGGRVEVKNHTTGKKWTGYGTGR